MPARPDQAFTAATDFDGRFGVVTLSGELDYATVAAVSQRLDTLIDRGCSAIVIDLSATTLLTSSVINIFFAAVRRLRLAGGGLALVCSHPRQLKLLNLTALDQVADVRATRDAAAAALIERGVVS